MKEDTDENDENEICSRAWCDKCDQKMELPYCCIERKDYDKDWRDSEAFGDIDIKERENARNLRSLPSATNPTVVADTPSSLSPAGSVGSIALPKGVFASDSRYFKTNVLGVIVEVFPENQFRPQNVLTSPSSDLVYVDGSYLRRTGPASFEVVTQAQLLAPKKS